ncbi:MAG: hypothetical protein JSW00_16290 [Thermoplasmata archaeon]|nr:MAG: hypothetical protein JSW00_16290 [Thermoplasmata archaeon]
MEDHINQLKDKISKAVSESIQGKDGVGILFSGGLDSSLVAFIAKKGAQEAEITLYTVGTFDSYDFLYAEDASKLLGMNLSRIEIANQEIIDSIPKLTQIIDIHHPVTISFELPLYLALGNIEEELILTGQGADELFGGYARYLKMGHDELEMELKKDVDSLITKDIEMDYQIARHFSKTLKIPYLDMDVVNCTMQIPLEYKVNEGQRKIILRELAVKMGLPREIALKEKKAVQYSSGILKELRRIAKGQGMEVNEFIEHLLKG